MGHLNTGTGEHDLTASAIIFRDRPEGAEVLLLRHKSLGVLLQPGGHVERSENPWQAVIREIAEETGLTIDDLTLIEPASGVGPASGVSVLPQPLCVNVHPIGDSHFHTDIVWALVCTGDGLLRPGADEAQEVGWVAVSDVREGRVAVGAGVGAFVRAALELAGTRSSTFEV